MNKIVENLMEKYVKNLLKTMRKTFVEKSQKSRFPYNSTKFYTLIQNKSTEFYTINFEHLYLKN